MSLQFIQICAILREHYPKLGIVKLGSLAIQWEKEARIVIAVFGGYVTFENYCDNVYDNTQTTLHASEQLFFLNNARNYFLLHVRDSDIYKDRLYNP